MIADSSVWVANPLEGTVTQVSVATSAVVRAIPVGGVPRSIATAGDRVWVALSNAELPAAGGRQAGGQALPATSCEPVVSGGDGPPDVLIASGPHAPGRRAGPDHPDGPGDRLRPAPARLPGGPVSRRLPVVRRLDRDDGPVRPSQVPRECPCVCIPRGARRRDRTFNSPCARVEIPILNRAPGGGLAMISPTNSEVGLTRVGPGQPAGQLAALYPTGKRTYLKGPADAGPEPRRAGARGQAAGAYTGRAAGRRQHVLRSGRPDRRLPTRGRAPRPPDRPPGGVGPARTLVRRACGCGGAEPRRRCRAHRRPLQQRRATDPDLRARLGRDVAILGDEGFAPMGSC